MDNFKFSGIVTDGTEPALYALVYVSDDKGNPIPGGAKTTTDEVGKYTIVGSGNYVTVSMVGYRNKTVKVDDLTKNTNIDISGEAKTNLNEVVVSATKPKPAPKKPFVPMWIAVVGSIIIVGGLLYYATSRRSFKNAVK